MARETILTVLVGLSLRIIPCFVQGLVPRFIVAPRRPLLRPNRVSLQAIINEINPKDVLGVFHLHFPFPREPRATSRASRATYDVRKWAF